MQVLRKFSLNVVRDPLKPVSQLPKPWALVWLVLWVPPAHAYIDPGIGSIIFQSVLAALITIAAFWRTLKQKVQTLFSGHRDSDSAPESDNAEEPE